MWYGVVECERVAVGQVVQQERAGPVALQHGERRLESGQVRARQQRAKDGRGLLTRDKTLLLDQAAGAVDALEIGEEVEQKVRRDVAFQVWPARPGEIAAQPLPLVGQRDA